MELSERIIKQLESEGHSTVYEIFDDPNYIYPIHNHKTEHAIIITEGSMEVTINEKIKTYNAGDHFKIPKDAKHIVKIGPDGCKYVIGE